MKRERTLSHVLRQFIRAEMGGVAVYSAFAGLLTIGAGALAVDVGRITVLRAQMQNRADAGAMAAASQLDGRSGAQARASAVAQNAMVQTSQIPSDSTSLSVTSINYYSEIDPNKVAATGDEDSRFAEVTLQGRQVSYLFSPVLGGSTPTSGVVQTKAMAGSSPFICHAPPLMICDPSELDPTLDLTLPANIGRQIKLKPPPSGGTAWAPGNYGLLALPDGSSGASDIQGALAAVTPPDCYQLDVSTATGVKTNKIQDGINARFDLPGGLPYPAPDVINYPRDQEIVADPTEVLGSGTWDIDAYWLAKHGGTVPAALVGASRYQVYLYEQGLEFGRNGKQTEYPIDGAPSAGFTLVTPPGADIPVDALNPDDPNFDGVPSQTVAPNGQARRVVRIAVLECVANDIKGAHSYPTNGNYIEGFITESVPDAPAGAIFIENVRPLTTTNSPDFHANARLVE